MFSPDAISLFQQRLEETEDDPVQFEILSAGGNYYLMEKSKVAAGGSNDFYNGIAQNGEQVGITINRNFDMYSKEELEKANENIELINARLGNAKNICPVIFVENEIKIAELGQCSLANFDIAKLTKNERLQFYKSMVEGLAELHRNVLQHRDVKPANFVVRPGKDSAWVIDYHDDLEELGTPCRTQSGTPFYFGPDQAKAFNTNPRGNTYYSNPKDDVWALMLTICELESSVDESDRIISKGLMDRFAEYRGALIKNFSASQPSVIMEQLKNRENFFSGVDRNDDQYPLDPVIVSMGVVLAMNRDSAMQIVESWPKSV